MKTKRLVALLTALVMAITVVPCIVFAASGDLLPVTDSYTATTGEKHRDPYIVNNHSDRPYAFSWTDGTGGERGYRMGVVAFDASGYDKAALKKAELTMTVYRTQNLNQSNVKSQLQVFAMDPSLVDNTNATNPPTPKSSEVIGVFDLSSLPTQKDSDVNMEVTAVMDLAKYFSLYPETNTVALLFANRDDIYSSSADKSLHNGLIGFYGVNDNEKAPKFKPLLTASVDVELKAGATSLLNTKVNELIVGEKFTPDESLAPESVVANGKYYVREELPEIEVAVGAKATVKYAQTDIKVDAITGGMAPALPNKFNVIKDSAIQSMSATWTGSAGKYTATIDGKASVTADVIYHENEYTPNAYYCSGHSEGADFGWKTDVGEDYASGVILFEADIATGSGTNRLLSYGNISSSTFDGVGPVVRYRKASNFEYYDGGWTTSTVPCDANKNYTIQTIVNLDNRTYRMYAVEQGKTNVMEITNGPAKFRNANLDHIDRFFYHGDDLDKGEQGNGSNTVVMLGHREVWLSGFVNITVNYSCGNIEISPSKKVRWAVGKTYIDSDAPKYKVIGSKIYVRKNTQNNPSITSNVDDTLNVEYDEVTVEEIDAEANTVVGQSLVMPSYVSVKFSNGQSVPFPVRWDSDDNDVSKEATYTVTGVIDELNSQSVSCTVNVKAVEPDDGTELNKVGVATNNGGWNWYVEPSGTHIQPGDALATRYESGDYSTGGYVFKNDKTYMGWVEDCGDIVVAEYDHNTGNYKRVVIHEKLESDDHNNPAVVILPDGRIMAVYSMHTNEPYMYFRVSKYPEDISEWNAEQYYYCYTKNDMEDNHDYNATYPTVFMVHDDCGIEGNDVIYIGWRGVHWKPTMAKFPMPDEDGQFFTEGGENVPGVVEPIMGQTQIANTSYTSFDDGGKADGQRRPYTKYDYDFDENKIYITFTANHPDNDMRNHIYYLYLNIEDQNLYTAKDNLLQPLPFENQAMYRSKGANGTTGQWGVATVLLYTVYPELVVFDASEQTGASFTEPNGNNHNERRGWTWDISHNMKGEPCIVYVDITATEPGENGSLPDEYLSEDGTNTRSHHYYWYARWDSDSQQWVKTYLSYGGKWFHQNATQERCYSGGLTFDHNSKDANVIYLSLPTEGKYGNVFEIYRWESDDHGATWTKRQAITQDSPVPNARPNAIYNYKMNDDGSNAGPRLLWISGEYRYWMNYEYKTGVKTDFPEIKPQDDPEMFADAALKSGGKEITSLSTGVNSVTGEFVVSNISIDAGQAKFALAHYDKNNKLIEVISKEAEIPARSVPRTGVPGADKYERENKLSPMGEAQVVINIPYEARFNEGDKIKLFAWDNGVEHLMSSIISIPVEISTSGSRFMLAEDFTYEGENKLMLNDSADTFNGWTGKAYNSTGEVAMNDGFYAAINKTVFGNSGIHLYRVAGSSSGEGIMASHSLPNTDGRDYTLEFSMRYINEQSWNNTANAGFTLSHGTPTRRGDTDHPSAIQFRHMSAWGNENGRGNTIGKINSVAFDDWQVDQNGNVTNLINTATSASLFRNDGLNDPDRYDKITYHKGDARYDNVDEVYIHDYNDTLMVGSLYQVKVNVHPSMKIAEVYVFDGYRMVETVMPFSTADNVDWDNEPIDTITFSVGAEKWGEIYIDNFRMYLSPTGSTKLKSVRVVPKTGTAMSIGSDWHMLPIGDAYVFFAADGDVIDVSGQSQVVGHDVGTWTYNGGDNQKFYLEETNGGYYIRGKQSNLYLNVNASGAVTIQEKTNATVFTITETDAPASAAVLEIVEMIEDGTFEATMDAILSDEE